MANVPLARGRLGCYGHRRLRHRSVCRVGVPPCASSTTRTPQKEAQHCSLRGYLPGPPSHVSGPPWPYHPAMASEPPCPAHLREGAGSEASRPEAIPIAHSSSVHVCRVHGWGLRNQSGEEAESEHQDRGTARAPPKRTGPPCGIRPSPPASPGDGEGGTGHWGHGDNQKT